MENILLIIVLLFLAGLSLLIWKLISASKSRPQNDQSLVLLQNQMAELNRALDAKLGQIASESRHTVSEVTRQSAKIIGDVTEKLTRVDEAARQTLAMNEEIKKLQDTLSNPKQRGILGEYLLETVLKNVMPPGQYQMQYPFKDGAIVDAVVFADKKIIPIDSKFSLENYKRFAEAGAAEKKKYESAFAADIKTRIDETSKYVKPQEDTMDFAFMFIPSEAVYYDLLINKVGNDAEDKNLITYAFRKKVIIVSPTSFLAYLQTVLQGLRNQKISEQAQEIIKQVDNLRRHLVSYEDYFTRIGKNLSTTVSAYNHAHKEFGKIDKDILKITGENAGIEPLAIEAPEIED